MNMTGPIRAVERPWLRPAKWLTPISHLAALTAALYSILLCGLFAPSLAVLGLVYVAIGLPYLVHAALRRTVVRRHRLPQAMLDMDAPRIRKARTTFAVTAVLLALRLPFYAAFLVSLPSLQRVAVREYEQTPQDAPRPHNILVGIFPVQQVRVDHRGATFYVWCGGTISYFPGAHIRYDWNNDGIPFFPRWYVPFA
jgi:hypothetical protein